MAKVIWWLTVIVCALVNHLNPYHMEELPFIMDHYYTSTLGVDDPAVIYASFFSMSDELYQPCNPANRDLRENEGTAVAAEANSMYTYFIPMGDKTFTDAASKLTYTVPAGTVVPILAPVNGYITTDPANSVDSTEMVYKFAFGEYSLRMVGLDHWYCCDGHSKYNGVGYKHCAVSKSDFDNRTFKQGQIIAFANSGTKILIQNENGEEVSFTELFGSNYTTSLDCTIAEATTTTEAS